MKPEMNHDESWEQTLDRQLKNLPLLKASPSVAARVMAAVAERQQAWYRQSWQNWSMPLRLSSALALALVFAGVCYLTWIAPHYGPVASGLGTVRTWLSHGGAWISAVGVVAEACCLAVKNLGTGFLVGCLCAAGLAYATFMGLGTVYLRLAMSRR